MTEEEITNWINAAPTKEDRQQRKVLVLALRYSATKHAIEWLFTPDFIQMAEQEIQLSKLLEENEKRLGVAFAKHQQQQWLPKSHRHDPDLFLYTGGQTGLKSHGGLMRVIHEFTKTGDENMSGEEFNFKLKDSDGYAPDSFDRLSDMALIGAHYRHTGNGKIYEIETFVWYGNEDTWLILHRQLLSENNAPPCVRSKDNFFGNRENGQPRFEYVGRKSTGD